MKTITKIATQKKTTNRFNIYLDHQYAFSVSEDILIRYHLHKGLELTETDIEKIQQADDRHRYYVMAIRYLSYRMRTEQEVRQYFRTKDVHPEVVEDMIDRLHREKLLNDEEFAKAFVRDRIQQTTKGPLIIKKELMEKGVSTSIIEKVIENYSYEKQLEKASKFAEKQLRRQSKHSYQKRLDQLKVKMTQRGFSQTIVNDVIQTLNFEKDTEEEYHTLVIQADKLYEKYRKKHDGFELIQKLRAALYRRGFDAEAINKYVEKIEQSM